jgi:hypothetical protein
MVNPEKSTCQKFQPDPFGHFKFRLTISPQGKARQGKARQGKARQGKARQGKARQGKARQIIKLIFQP